jgi:hypothetical protein
VEEAFRALLLARAQLMALISADRVVFGDVLQGRAYPLITMMTVSGAEGMTMRGPDGLFEGRVQVDCYAESMAEAKRLAREVIAGLHGHRSTGTGPRFAGIFHETTRDGREGSTNDADRPFRTSLDFTVYWRTR